MQFLIILFVFLITSFGIKVLQQKKTTTWLARLLTQTKFSLENLEKPQQFFFHHILVLVINSQKAHLRGISRNKMLFFHSKCVYFAEYVEEWDRE